MILQRSLSRQQSTHTKHADAQVVVISDPELTGQVLDRSRTPQQIDKPHEPMFYHVVDEVGCPLTCPNSSQSGLTKMPCRSSVL